MGENSKIQWTTHTQNWWIGCTEVSSACDSCYARALSERYGWAQWGDHPRHRTSASNWRKPFAWNKSAAGKTDRPRVFTNSLSDFFDNQVDPVWRDRAWEVIAECRNMDWLILTKRPQNIVKMLPKSCATQIADHDWPWPHVWLGITAETQGDFDRRWPYIALMNVTTFVSYEPALGPLSFLREPMVPDLVIFGGESGPKKRPVDLQWGRDLRDECAALGVCFFGKQHDGIRELPADLLVRQMPRSLDGVTHDGVPT